MSMKVAIIGMGLIGGSVALSLRAAWPDAHIAGIDRDEAQLSLAREALAIDSSATQISAIDTSDVVLVCVPVAQSGSVFVSIAPHLRDGALLTDVGSTKQSVIAAARAHLGEKISQFVPGHPIAGREHAGFSAATATLFEGKNVVLTPLAENTPASVEQARLLWRACGANVVDMTADAHDAIFAAVSHLPHLLAFALVDDLAQRPNARSLFSFAASGFRDFTRIASSSPEMWRDIALNNREALLVEMDRYLEHAALLREALANADGTALIELMSRAREARDNWLAGELDHFRDESA